MTTVKIVRAFPDTDLRSVHRYRNRLQKLRPGEAVLYTNVDGTKARLIDAAKAVHNYYAPKGTVFDVEEIQKQVAALGLTLQLDNATAQKAGFGKEREAA